MSGSFACPECGGIVELRGLAPGRQVRCGFCQQLLEVPYLPRVPSSRGRRRAWPRWAIWAWLAIGLTLAVILTWGGLRYWTKHQQSRRAASIHRMIASSEAHEQAGHLSEALIDLDAALELARQVEGSHPTTWEAQRTRRQDLARRDAEKALDGLDRQGSSSLPLGDWLNLIARSEHDPDLEPLQSRIVQRFRSKVGQRLDAELASARRMSGTGHVAGALEACDRIPKLLKHLDVADQRVRRHDAEELVTRLLERHGIVIGPMQGEFLFGSEATYQTSLLPVVSKRLEAKGYLPNRAGSPWADLWKKARYRLNVHISERKEGTYPSSQSRLTLIRVRLLLTTNGVSTWENAPGSRARVPVPNLPAYQSGNLAVESGSSDVLEQLLFKDALSQVGEKVNLALTSMPACEP
jgi:hypothetical protein